ncbi:coiled-coil domain-containing protein 7A isoform X2 [Arvicanthis niloticus]|uniref:coiled-coil domain-containing protein 7A isoform X2 n=1 Tax=Arvicanthis niloticus TaxID=61156 RepID=UPI00402B27F7
MKRAKHPSTISKKLTSVPEFPFKKGLLISSPKPKEKQNAKSTPNKIESMVLRSPPTGESIVRFALPIPLIKTKQLISNDEMIRRITTNLKMVVSKLENTYGGPTEDRERDEGGLSVGDDVSSFLLCCSQFAAQLEEAVKEERGVLESLYKWFQHQVNQMEEISKDQSNVEKDLQSDGKSASLSIVQIAKLAHKFEDIKGRLKERKAAMQTKEENKAVLLETLKNYGLIEKQIEEFLKSHSALEPKTEPESASAYPGSLPGTPTSVTNRMNTMMKIFENQTTMLEKALTEHSVIECKFKQMETDFQMLLLEKTLLEGEIRRLRELENEKSASKEERTKKSGRLEKKKIKEKWLSPTMEFKSFEELLQIQKEAEVLKSEKKTLQEQLKWALEEAERNKSQLDFVLHQKMEMFKEEKSKTKLDQSHSKSKVKGEDSKDYLSKKSDTQSGEQRKDQLSSDKSKRSVKRLHKKQFADIDPLALEDFPMMLIEEQRESISSQPNEEDEASEQTEAGNIEGPLEIASESPNEDDDLLPEDEAPTMEQITDSGRHKSIYIDVNPPDTMSLISRTQSEMDNLEATKYEDVLYEDEEQDKNFVKEASGMRGKSKRKRGSKIEKLPPHEEESDTVHYEEATKTKEQAPGADGYEVLSPESRSSVSKPYEHTKKQRTHKRGKGSPPGADGYEVLSPESRSSVSKPYEHTKKQRTHKRGKGSPHGKESDIVTYEERRKSKAPSRRKGFAIPVIAHSEAHSSESQDSISKSDTETKEQGTHKRGKDADGAFGPASQVIVSKADTKTKKQRSKRERTVGLNEVPDKNYEHQESGLKFEIQAKKLKMFRPENIHNEEADTDVRLENQNVPSSSQVQLKKPKSLGGEIFTIHFAAPDESHIRLHQEYTTETQVQGERGTTSGNARLTTIPLEHPKKEASADHLFAEKKLYITTTQSQTKRQYPPRDENAETQKKSVTEVQGPSGPQTEMNPTMSDIIFQLDMNRVVETDPEKLKEATHVLRSELEIGTDTKKMPATSSSREPVKTESQSNQDKNIYFVKGIKLLGKLKDQHGLSSSANKDTIILDETKPQRNMSDKYYKSMKFSTKVINLSPFTSKEKSLESTKVAPTPFHRTSRRSSGLSEALQHLLNITASGHTKPTSVKKQSAELEKHLRISGRSSNTLKGQSKHQKLKKQGALTSIKKQKHKEQPKPEPIVRNNVEFDDTVLMTASPPNIKIIKELSETLNLDGGDIELSDLLLKSASAVKKLGIKGLSKTSNLDKEDSQATHILHLSTSAIMKLLLKEEAKIRRLEKKLFKGSKILHKSSSSLKKFMFEEPSKTKKKRKKRKIIVKNPYTLPITTTQKLMLKDQSAMNNLEKPIVRGTSILKKSAKKRVLKGKSKPETLHKKCDNPSDDLVLSTSSASKQEVEEQPKPENVDKKVFDDSYSLKIPTSPIKKHILKEQSESRKLYNKGVGLPDTLVLSLSGSSKQEDEEQPKPENVDKEVFDDSYSLKIPTSPIKKHILKGQSKSRTLYNMGVGLPHNLVLSTSDANKQDLKGQSKSRTLYNIGVDLPNNLVLSTSDANKQELKGQPKPDNSAEKGFKRPNNLHTSASTARKRLLKALSTIP